VKTSGVAARRSRSPATRRWTTNPALQAYLTQLVSLAEAGDREAFARAFVPLDLTEEDLMGYVTDLRQNEQQWAHVRRAQLTSLSALSFPATVRLNWRLLRSSSPSWSRSPQASKE
jgi:hypothetical protein